MTNPTFYELKSAASKVWSAQLEIADVLETLSDPAAREVVKATLENVVAAANALDRKASIAYLEASQDRCSCNGTEVYACSFCREKAKTAEIPF